MRIQVHLETLIAAVLAAGCVGVGGKDDTGLLNLDDTACLSVEQGEACPDAATAAEMLVGTTTCESPSREIVAVGAFVSQEDVVYTGYGGWNEPSVTGGSGDTGTSEEVSTRCCYEAAYKILEGQDCTIGRPLSNHGAPCFAPLEARADWAQAAEGPAAVDPEAAAWWARQGQLEHASVAAFGQLVLDLLRLGAPAALVERAGAALRDEVRHAELCFGLATRFGGQPVGPGRLAVPGGRARKSLTRLAVEAWREGCLGETGSVGVAAAQVAGATDPVVRRVATEILTDEARHAALSWDLVAWAIEVGGARVRRAVEREVSAIGMPNGLATTASAVRRGVPDPARVREALERVQRDVVTPGRAALLAA